MRDFGKSSLWFGDITELLGVKYDDRFKGIISSLSCLMTIVRSGSSEDITKLIYFIKELRIEKKYLFIMAKAVNRNNFQNMTINFNVIIINEESKGNASVVRCV